MPLYEYKCPDCGGVESDIVPIEQRQDSRECPNCGGQMRRTWSTFQFVFRSPSWQPYSPETSGRDELVREEIAVSE